MWWRFRQLDQEIDEGFIWFLISHSGHCLLLNSRMLDSRRRLGERHWQGGRGGCDRIHRSLRGRQDDRHWRGSYESSQISTHVPCKQCKYLPKYVMQGLTWTLFGKRQIDSLSFMQNKIVFQYNPNKNRFFRVFKFVGSSMTRLPSIARQGSLIPSSRKTEHAWFGRME